MVYSQALVLGYGLSVGAEEDNLADLLKKFFRLDKEGWGTRSTLTKATSSSSLSSESSWEEDEDDMACLKLDLIKQIESCLVSAKAVSLSCRELLLPAGMTTRVAGDLLRASGDEPCGLRGAVIHLFLENKSGVQKLGTITADQSLTPTFELSVVFREDPDVWPPLRHLLGTEGAVRLRAEYRLIKRKLYSSASPIVMDCC
ncbi:DNA damage-inducible transcript 4-like protein [Astyanax mexicanus]|uniref:DNA damage inducible transcript 4 like n=1 Tax=Astyanax mexicanus TaxID=7994 RepID=A0A8B9LXS3_ASTMX|nr:DNA damage-inducible transcript 4-like protein [Astyanax mexicanus]